MINAPSAFQVNANDMVSSDTYFATIFDFHTELFLRASNERIWQSKKTCKLVPLIEHDRLLVFDSYYLDMPTLTEIETSNMMLDFSSPTKLVIAFTKTQFHVYSLGLKVQRIAVIQLGFEAGKVLSAGSFLFISSSDRQKCQKIELNTFETHFVKESSLQYVLSHEFPILKSVTIAENFKRSQFFGWSEDKELVIAKFSDKKIYQTKLPYSRVTDLFEDKLFTYHKNVIRIFDIYQQRLIAHCKCPTVTKLLAAKEGFVLCKNRAEKSTYYIIHVPSKTVVNSFKEEEWFILDFNLAFKREGKTATRSSIEYLAIRQDLKAYSEQK